MNVPGAKASERIVEISQCIQFLNDLAPDRRAFLVEMAEYAKRSSKRGISDEEREVEEALWALRQGLDTRWVMPFNLHPAAEQQSNRRQVWSRKGRFIVRQWRQGMSFEKTKTFFSTPQVFNNLISQTRLNRRFSNGRLVANIDSNETNAWITCSELAICGRPLNENPIVLPLSRDLILPESLSPEDDLRQAERQRPSVETASAQKGVSRWVSLLESVLNVNGINFKDKCVVVLNLTGYIEDVGCAVSWFETWAGMWHWLSVF